MHIPAGGVGCLWQNYSNQPVPGPHKIQLTLGSMISLPLDAFLVLSMCQVSSGGYTLDPGIYICMHIRKASVI